MKRFHNRKGGFTLIELMIVVAIIGILAAIAIPNFLRFQLKAKSSEGKTNLAAIRTSEESYYSEFGVYVSATASPDEVGQNQKKKFVNQKGLNAGFDKLGWLPEGFVFFNYVVATDADTSKFTATAAADIDADESGQTWGYKKASDEVFQDGGSHGAYTTACDVTKLTPETVMACELNYGQSVF
jgi:type IV pilus assembly protein PilA